MKLSFKLSWKLSLKLSFKLSFKLQFELSFKISLKLSFKLSLSSTKNVFFRFCKGSNRPWLSLWKRLILKRKLQNGKSQLPKAENTKTSKKCIFVNFRGAQIAFDFHTKKSSIWLGKASKWPKSAPSRPCHWPWPWPWQWPRDFRRSKKMKK